jgi:tonB-dependent haem/haemoglobin receptor
MVILIIESGEKMRFKSLIKLSLVASVAVCANAAGESVLSGVEVTSSSGGYGVDDIKFQLETLA